ncbi:hypothetical protein BG004_005729 [Podila humilis]|nr:hypothetical protein BG004_005729 [Podila humilis]
MQKIARDMLDIKKYDYCLRLVRHISQEEDELWVAPHSETKNEMQGIPSKLLLLPKDANFLVDVYFENACFYYPIVNRSTVELLMMEPQTPQALFLLNIIFMAACKHLARNTDIKRAVQFRERAREIQHYIDGKTRLSRMQAIILGSQVIYGSFVIVIGMSQDAGTFGDMNNGRENTKAKEVEKEDDEEAELLGGLDLQAESRSIQSKKGTIPEAAYQARLWAFWAFYLRDSMARLYFGWPHGMDTVLVTAELPKIKGCVGMGGKSKSLTGTSEMESVSNIGGSSSGTRKRRESTFNRNLSLPGKRVMKSENRSELTDQGMYRTTLSMVDNDEDTDDDNEDVERSRSSYDSDDQMNHSVLTPDTRPISAEGGEQFHGFYGPGGANNQDQEMTHASVNKRSTLKNAIARGAQERPSLSGLSKTLLEQQSRGKTPSRRHSLGDVQEAKRHMDRMKLLLEAEEDVTDGDSYARILFLEEVKLWSIGRRVALYLANRASSVATTNPQLDNDAICHPFGSAALSSSSSEAGRCSERAWLRDQELQSIQADLIAWDQALPELLRFRSDVDQPDVNHKVNGKMGILTMFYYTITIMLQSSYLPIPQYLFSSQPTSRASSYKSPESLCREFDGVFSRAMSTTSSILDETRIKLEADDFFRSNNNNSNSANNQNHYQQTTGYGTPRSPSKGTTTTNSNKGYFFNTAHQICTQLSNVLYHHVEMLLDSYPNWCTIQAKLNHSLIAAMRVSCLNARLSSNSRAIRDESKAGFKYGSELFKRQAVLPEPLTIRDWPPEEDVQVMMDLEEEFRGLMTSQEEDLAAALSEGLAGLEGGNNYDDEDFFHGAEGEGGGIGGSASGGASRDGVNTGTTGNSSSSGGDGGGSAFYPMYHQNDGQSGFYPPHSNDPAQGLPLNPQLAMVGAASAGTAGYDLFQGHNNGSTSGLGVVVGQPQHIFGLGNDGFKFEYNIDT